MLSRFISLPGVRHTLSHLAVPVLALPRTTKRTVVLLLDFAMCVLSVWLAYYLRLGEFVSFFENTQWSSGATWAASLSIVLALPIFIATGLYRAIFRYSGWPALLTVVRAVSIYGFLYAVIVMLGKIDGLPRTIGIIQPLLLLFLVGISRAFARVWLGDQYQHILRQLSRPNVLIYGAGHAGRQLARAMLNCHEMQVVGFLDDDQQLQGQILNGQPIYHPNDLADLAATLNVSSVLLAMPSLSRHRRNEILAHIRKTHVAVRTLPSVTDLAQGRVSLSDLQELDIDDLLGREPVLPNNALMSLNIQDKVVMVTGAGGSIGSELCRQILALTPKKLLLVEQSEFALYAIHQELEAKVTTEKITLIPLLASVQNYERMHEIIATWHPYVIYHAAAYKHVPLVEHNPAEGVKNNVFGTLGTAQAAVHNNVPNFVLISTDKAVRPTNMMGASKRLAEMVLQALAKSGTNTKFSMVRFGNVLGSSGSVVPKFRQQIRNGEPITLTHPDIIRYFMTIPEASQLVIQAGAMAEGGDVFVLDMGEPVKIIDLAHRMVELSGLSIRDENNPDGDIEIQITGLRPGEKLYEELLIGNDPEPTPHPRIMKAHETYLFWDKLQDKLSHLEHLLSTNDVDAIYKSMKELIPEYIPVDQPTDWVYLEQTL